LLALQVSQIDVNFVTSDHLMIHGPAQVGADVMEIQRIKVPEGLSLNPSGTFSQAEVLRGFWIVNMEHQNCTYFF